MLKLFEIVGMLGPIAGIVVLAVHRRRAPRAAAVGILGASFATAASIAGFIGARAAYFGGDGLEGISERVEQWSTVRLALLLIGAALLVAAALVGSGAGRRGRGTIVVVGVIAVAIGAALRYATVDLHAEHEFLNVLIPMALEAVQFAFLGAGALILSLAVVSLRPTAEDAPEPLARARQMATSLWGAYRDSRTRR